VLFHIRHVRLFPPEIRAVYPQNSVPRISAYFERIPRTSLLSVFSTIIHSFPQLFSANPLDAENQNIYLPRQIEPEDEDLTVRFRVREFLTVFAVPNLTGKLKDFATQRTRRNRFTAIPLCAEFGSSEKSRCREQPAIA
jgi:hypothetical protein